MAISHHKLQITSSKFQINYKFQIPVIPASPRRSFSEVWAATWNPELTAKNLSTHHKSLNSNSVPQTTLLHVACYMMRDKNMKIIAGLGNPDQKYSRTRHNVGFMVVDQLAESQRLSWQLNKDWNLLMAKGSDFILVKPLTYMNNSGLAIRKIMDYYDLMPAKSNTSTDLHDSLIVIHDELDIPLGEFKLATGANGSSHNGIKSTIEHLGTKNFTRYRVGIATPELDKYRQSIFGNRAHKFVLKNFHKPEEALVQSVAQKIIEQLS